MSMKPRSLWLSATPRRAMLEALSVAALTALASLPFVAQQPLRPGIQDTVAVLLVAGPCCALWCALRLRLDNGEWWQRAVLYAAMGCVLSVIPTTTATLWLLRRFADPNDIIRERLGAPLAAGLVVAAYVAFAGAFVAFRAAISVWLYWDGLRRRHLRWALTHAHLSVVVLGAGLIFGLLVLTHLSNPPNLAFYILPLLFLLGFITVVALLLVLSPSALFSYLFARPLTHRLEALTDATNALRAGNYAVRVSITGEDEVAQLQANFNAMAADLERAVRELQAERDTVAKLLESRGQLVASVSHELRTPVATLRGYLESLLSHWSSAPPATLRHDLEVMEREAIRLQALIDDLFTLSRVEVDQLTLHCEALDVAPVVRRLVETFAPLAWQSHRVEVTSESPAETLFAQADSRRLEQALHNLLRNALRHTFPGGIIVVSVAADPGAVVLQVKDTGEGIAPEELDHIWDRFYRGEQARAQDESGSGLGLALVKELTEAMGGSVAVESKLGQGSCFAIRLPRVVDQTSSPAASEVARTAPAATPATR